MGFPKPGFGYDPDTLYGERHAPDMTADESYEAWAHVAVKY